jgi:hypothetical protein
MFTSIILGINKQRPDVDVYVTDTGHPFIGLLKSCGCVFGLAKSDVDVSKFDGYVEHVVYHCKTHCHLFYNIVFMLNRQVPWLNLNPFNCPPAVPVNIKPITHDHDYVVIPADHSLNKVSKLKCFNDWETVISKIWEKYKLPVLELSVSSDQKVFKNSSGVVKVGNDYGLSAGLINNSTFVIAIENGLSHFVGQLGKTCFTIYNNDGLGDSAKQEQVWWPGQIPVYVGYGNPTADDVINTIDKWYNRKDK